MDQLEVLIVTYNSASHLIDCVQSIQRSLPSVRINVIDNASCDATKQILNGLALHSVQLNERNRMLSSEWNRFAKGCDCKYILLVNPDVVINNGTFILNAVNAMECDESLAIAARIHRVNLGDITSWRPPVRPADRHVFRELLEESVWFKTENAKIDNWRNIELSYADGCCMVVRRDAILKLGGFAETLPLYFNDTEISVRLLGLGMSLFPLWSNNDGNLFHELGGSSGVIQQKSSRFGIRFSIMIEYCRKTLKKSGILSVFRRFRMGTPIVIRRFEKAVHWLAVNSVPGAGIRVVAGGDFSYPEVSGYFIPTLLEWGQRDRAIHYAQWLLSIQNPNGSWSDPAGNTAYTFDTGQVLKGLIAIAPVMPEVEPAIIRACDWLLTQIRGDGRILTPDKSAWELPDGKIINENIHLYVLEPLRAAGIRLNEPRYLAAVERALQHYLALSDLVNFNTLSHFHAYVIEALIDLGYPELAKAGMEYVGRLQRDDGSIPGYPDVDWVCSTGLAQYAVIWYKLGNVEPAQKAFSYLCRLQNPSGGFFGSYGWNANYFPDKEISWAVKYFLDALKWKIRTEFDTSEPYFPVHISSEDGRYRLVRETIRAARAESVLDAGCGKGRFLKLLALDFPAIHFSGLDISEAMLRNLPETVVRILGGVLDIPVADESFDLVFTVEALEHSVDVRRAIRELSRVVAPGGTLLIIDKSRDQLGRLKISEWEQWFNAQEVADIIRGNGFTVSIEHNIPYDGCDGRDGLFIGWVATKE